ncbi:PQQ-binding-like beta-propeller repeat protein [Streptomyces globisporus]|uniref:outer membrane protein assembly factor BamB family protein n=1 Tax=Streptomyces globisporus TaxID=1908 RepID=UPI0004C62DF8|nr:PQQ-binding-like beta-propeller repeat protein [Streptomyces globisporus]
MTRDGFPGAAFGAAVVFLGAGVAAGAWPTGWAALVCALVCGALGATLLAVRRRGTEAPTAPDKVDAKPARPGRSSLVAAALIWALALLAGGIWTLTSGGDDTDDTAADARPTADPTASLDTRPAIAWTVPPVGRKYDESVGHWGLGSAVAQGRIDGLFAYDGTDGRVRWSVPAPTREALCAMSQDVEEGVGLIAYGRHGKPCATLLAVRASDGEVLWKRTLGGKGLAGDERPLAVGGATAVSAEDGAVRARSVETGRQRWQHKLGEGCASLAVDAGADRTLLVEQCGESAKLLALDTRTGARKWARDLPVESKATAAVVSLSPIVLAVDEADARGTHAFLGFDDKGTPTVTVPLSGPEGVLSAPVGAGDSRRPVVRDGLLVTLAEAEELVPDVVVAYSLKDGRKAWSHHAENQTMTLAAEPDGRVAVLENHDKGRILLLDRTTGKVAARIEPDTAEGAALSIHPELVPVTGGHVVLNQILMQAEPAAFALR